MLPLLSLTLIVPLFLLLRRRLLLPLLILLIHFPLLFFLLPIIHFLYPFLRLFLILLLSLFLLLLSIWSVLLFLSILFHPFRLFLYISFEIAKYFAFSTQFFFQLPFHFGQKLRWFRHIHTHTPKLCNRTLARTMTKSRVEKQPAIDCYFFSFYVHFFCIHRCPAMKIKIDMSLQIKLKMIETGGGGRVYPSIKCR